MNGPLPGIGWSVAGERDSFLRVLSHFFAGDLESRRWCSRCKTDPDTRCRKGREEWRVIPVEKTKKFLLYFYFFVYTFMIFIILINGERNLFSLRFLNSMVMKIFQPFIILLLLIYLAKNLLVFQIPHPRWINHRISY